MCCRGAGGDERAWRALLLGRSSGIVREGGQGALTRVMIPSLSTSLAGLCGILRGVDRPLLGGEEPAIEEAG